MATKELREAIESEVYQCPGNEGPLPSGRQGRAGMSTCLTKCMDFGDCRCGRYLDHLDKWEAIQE